MRHYGHICPCRWTPYQRLCLFYLTSDPAVHSRFFRGLRERVMKQQVSGDEYMTELLEKQGRTVPLLGRDVIMAL